MGLRHTLCFCLYRWELSPASLGPPDSGQRLSVSPRATKVWGPKLWVRDQGPWFMVGNPPRNGESDGNFTCEMEGQQTLCLNTLFCFDKSSGDDVTSLTRDSSL